MTSETLPDTLAAMRPALHRYCARMMGSAFDGEDVVQDAYAKAGAALAAGAEVEEPQRWLFRIAHNAALDAIRKRRREAFDLLDEEVPGGAPAESRAAASAALSTFLAIPPGQRAVVVLADVLGHSGEEVAAILDTTLAAVKAALHRGRARLRDMAEAPVRLDPAERARLEDYAARFNAHDWDALRELLAEDVRLDLVARTRLAGAGNVGVYFTRYAENPVWRMEVGVAEGRPVVVARSTDGVARFVVLLDWQGGRIAGIRDFHYAGYVMEGLGLD
ncbi:sigma-70 family RNA polymerase sigma factor [Sphingomonas sp. R-74633]|uniref:sigma-70 family RNA polymerase sigma factor n=1 Tax=Sphingomonas sp. R-74633 TaxID=2751188 RepID=UPI0015D2E4DD|nr:sigma-70 family RNA polymerase sigma factor [Sphingomonas sp. R-74633]NYT42896.1 sigma-70 family RNA polymerase sigma factor [Sphingomonas sp. R-74633]